MNKLGGASGKQYEMEGWIKDNLESYLELTVQHFEPDGLFWKHHTSVLETPLATAKAP